MSDVLCPMSDVDVDVRCPMSNVQCRWYPISDVPCPMSMSDVRCRWFRWLSIDSRQSIVPMVPMVPMVIDRQSLVDSSDGSKSSDVDGSDGYRSVVVSRQFRWLWIDSRQSIVPMVPMVIDRQSLIDGSDSSNVDGTDGNDVDSCDVPLGKKM